MIWLTWRQHRAVLAVTLVAVVTLVAWMLVVHWLFRCFPCHRQVLHLGPALCPK